MTYVPIFPKKSKTSLMLLMVFFQLQIISFRPILALTLPSTPEASTTITHYYSLTIVFSTMIKQSCNREHWSTTCSWISHAQFFYSSSGKELNGYILAELCHRGSVVNFTDELNNINTVQRFVHKCTHLRPSINYL